MGLRRIILCTIFMAVPILCFAQKTSSIKIGFAHVGNNNPYYMAMERTAKIEASKLGFEIIMTNAQNDQVVQNEQINSLFEKGIEGLIVNPVSEYGVMPVIKRAKELGIPVIAIDRPMYGDYVAYVGIDQWMAGQLQGDYIVKHLMPKGGNIVVLLGIPGEPATIGREQGMLNVLEHPNNKGRYNILASYRADYNMDKGYEKMNEAIRTYGEKIQLVYALNDAMALGALRALRQAKLSNTMVLGIDGQNEAFDEIAKAGQYKSTIINNPIEITQKALSYLRTYLRTKKNGSLEKIITGTKLVTKENVKKFKKDGAGF